MELRIGENIKRLRTARRLTQEQLADMLCISGAAVSKWKTADTYPDIGMLFPLARIFGVSVDMLMGYDAARTQVDIDDVLAQYTALTQKGKREEASVCMIRLWRTYPDNYRVMLAYLPSSTAAPTIPPMCSTPTMLRFPSSAVPFARGAPTREFIARHCILYPGQTAPRGRRHAGSAGAADRAVQLV